MNSEILNKDINRYFNNLSLNEEKGRSRQRGIYKFYAMIGYSIEVGEFQRGLDDILADLRAVENVTIVTVVIANQRIGEERYVAGLSIKFIPSVPGEFKQPEDVKASIIKSMKRIKNVQRIFKISTSLERIE